ncbi:Hint domain-containing protein [Cognatiyoonia koreensis]|uniref:Hint domain-containing protein n=1 Tax=Cognatiyoonia koreensis TaxID=364200 RepID=A0A1I0MSC4_9RHOB|nr:Hint domain-containing protein [Cognatiyoonia koreensis]SEV91155.1 Hint domain-containing protein [Cognatiyoonia koreensis]
MKTGFRGTFVISWTQTELDGQQSPPVADLGPGRSWSWTGEAVRVDGPSGVLPLGMSEGEADLRKRAALTVRRLLLSMQTDTSRLDRVVLQDPLFDKNFVVTDGFDTWTVAVVSCGAGRKPLLMFQGEIPPRARELWVVRDNIGARLRSEAQQRPGGVICFTPGTMILTDQGPRDVASLREGDKIQTKDNGVSEILWLGQRHVTGARLMAMPALVPVRLRAGALEKDVPDAGLLVSPDHRMVLRGPRARALFSADEVLVPARDLVNDHTVIRDHAVKAVTYIHMLLPQHEIVFANGVATESFHPASAALATMQADEKDRLFDRIPDVRRNVDAYGGYARRVLSKSETAILRHYA